MTELVLRSSTIDLTGRALSVNNLSISTAYSIKENTPQQKQPAALLLRFPACRNAFCRNALFKRTTDCSVFNADFSIRFCCLLFCLSSSAAVHLPVTQAFHPTTYCSTHLKQENAYSAFKVELTWDFLLFFFLSHPCSQRSLQELHRKYYAIH